MKVFIVDDDAVQRNVMREQLKELGHEVRDFATGEALLEAVDDAPDLVFLDIEMPGMGGLEACRAWRAAESQSAQIAFISSHETLEMRLAAYDAGGTDFIAKPVDMLEFQRKVRIAERTIMQQHALVEQAHFAGKTAFTALSTLGEMGVVQQFMHTLFSASSTDEIVRAIFHTLQQFGLKGIIEVRLDSMTQVYSSRGECSALEVSLVKQAAKMGRIFQLRDRLVINYPVVSLLLHDLPLDDEERIGRMRDHLAILVEGSNTRILALEGEQAKLIQEHSAMHMLVALADKLNDIHRNQAINRMRAEEINNQLQHEQLTALENLGLVDGQEKTLLNITQCAHEELSMLRDADGVTGDQLRAVVGQLYKLAGQNKAESSPSH